MKKIIIMIGCISLLQLSFKLNTSNLIIPKYAKDAPIDIKHKKLLLLQKSYTNYKIGNINKFLSKLAHKESGKDWTAVNSFNYAGKYQLGQALLTDLDYTLDIEEFKINPHIFPERVQDSLMIEAIKLNRSRLAKYIKKYKGTKVNGIHITESGLIAAAHLLGSGSVTKWIKSKGKCNITDGNGVFIEEYLIQFSKYKLKLNS